MGDASEGERLLEGQWEQPSASWLALNVPAGQAGTQRDHVRINGRVSTKDPSLELKNERFCNPNKNTEFPSLNLVHKVSISG
jgi:hypothetical protein